MKTWIQRGMIHEGPFLLTVYSRLGGISLTRNFLSAYYEPATVLGTVDKMTKGLGSTLKTGKAVARSKEGRIKTMI